MARAYAQRPRKPAKWGGGAPARAAERREHMDSVAPLAVRRGRAARRSSGGGGVEALEAAAHLLEPPEAAGVAAAELDAEALRARIGARPRHPALDRERRGDAGRDDLDDDVGARRAVVRRRQEGAARPDVQHRRAHAGALVLDVPGDRERDRYAAVVAGDHASGGLAARDREQEVTLLALGLDELDADAGGRALADAGAPPPRDEALHEQAIPELGEADLDEHHFTDGGVLAGREEQSAPGERRLVPLEESLCGAVSRLENPHEENLLGAVVAQYRCRVKGASDHCSGGQQAHILRQGGRK